MFGGFGAWGEAAWGDIPGGAVVITANGALVAQAASMAGLVELDVDVNGVLVAQAAAMAGSVEAAVNQVNGALAASAAIMAGLMRRNQGSAFDLSGEATLEFVGTLPIIDLIEADREKLSYAAEIKLRSL